ITDTLDLKPLLEAVGDAVHHVRNQGAGEAMEGAMLAAVGGTRDHDLVVDLLDADVAMDLLPELALGPVDGHALGLDRDRDTRGMPEITGLRSSVYLSVIEISSPGWPGPGGLISYASM